jgi:hypothetical protein
MIPKTFGIASGSIHSYMPCKKMKKVDYLIRAETWIIPKPSLEIGTASAIFWIYLGIFRDYDLKNIFFRNKTVCF